ncbi:N-acyl-D-glucosamine 2-epimerase [Mucilaginibacter robiniae]|uniref:Cellobiose 2-epimerase n=1 Tax=Mucilaginibacter robiniae TaxID=2728022 RepID=A0A7L5DZE7_9SPHI|nr:AGE family epimerase/isomerase [Mucilaginibacter robiniae]QJD96482.1 N-acyl-D-glucosamine 2-epimerase [Mucilaginibacter robiniae]
MLLQSTIEQQLITFKEEVTTELHQILSYWLTHTPDQENGGFYGKIDHQNHVYANAPKGSVLHARILWAFSAAYNLYSDESYKQQAERSYLYLLSNFIDKSYGGIYWTVTYDGKPLDTKKQVYANAFVIYALAEYHKTFGNEDAKQLAISLYRLLVKKSYDTAQAGYLEAFTREWQPISDLRLSAKDANEKKTMNTHLHVLEAYANLYRIWPDKGLKQQIATLLDNFINHIIDAQTHHLILFFDENWNQRSDTISYGHDIEASWLLLEAAEIIGDESRIAQLKKLAVEMAEATTEGLDADGGLWYEYEPAGQHLIKEKHWWVQAEAIVGFYNAWQITDNVKYAELALNNWNFVKQHILDRENGEWVWGITADGSLMLGEDKAGLWKCPYHNSRTCLEIIKRIK